MGQWMSDGEIAIEMDNRFKKAGKRVKRKLQREALQRVVQNTDVSTLAKTDLFQLFVDETDIRRFAPDGYCQVDPRDGTVVVYSSARARRPHDNRDTSVSSPVSRHPCPICEGNTTGVVDVASLTEGVTFINKNLFPCVYMPADWSQSSRPRLITPEQTGGREPVEGLHLLQWTSSIHDNDWHNMPLDDLAVVVKRLGVLEQLLVEQSGALSDEPSGYVTIIKNVGAPVGGSLVHGHQQIVYSNLMSRRAYEHRRFEHINGEPFSRFLLSHTDKELIVRDFGSAVLVVPYFMRRPYDMMLIIKNTDAQYLYQLTKKEQRDLAAGWAFCAKTYRTLLPGMGREYAYNAVVHNGPGAGLYVEFLPFTQENGGLEQAGMVVCQNNPQAVADVLKAVFDDA